MGSLPKNYQWQWVHHGHGRLFHNMDRGLCLERPHCPDCGWSFDRTFHMYIWSSNANSFWSRQIIWVKSYFRDMQTPKSGQVQNDALQPQIGWLGWKILPHSEANAYSTDKWSSGCLRRPSPLCDHGLQGIITWEYLVFSQPSDA